MCFAFCILTYYLVPAYARSAQTSIFEKAATQDRVYKTNLPGETLEAEFDMVCAMNAIQDPSISKLTIAPRLCQQDAKARLSKRGRGLDDLRANGMSAQAITNFSLTEALQSLLLAFNAVARAVPSRSNAANMQYDRRGEIQYEDDVRRSPKPPSPSPGKLTGKKKQKDKLAKQRAGGQGSLKVSGAPRDAQEVRIEVARRGQKFVTMVKGLEEPMDARKKLLKQLKAKIGGGGALDAASGVLELQGDHGEMLLDFLKKNGFIRAKQSGSKR